MVKVSIASVRQVDRGVLAKFKVFPIVTGFVVQRIEWRAVVNNERFQGGWSEAWTMRRRPRKLEQQLEDLFEVPDDWHDGEMSIQAIAWFQPRLPATFQRVSGQTDKWGRLRGTDELVDPPDGAEVLERLWKLDSGGSPPPPRASGFHGFYFKIKALKA